MRKLLSIWLKELEALVEDDKGATSIEYAMIAGTVTLAIVFALSDIEASLNVMFTSIGEGFK